MNQVFAGGLALIIALILWSSKKRSIATAFLKSQKNSFPTSNATNSLVQKKKIENKQEIQIQTNLKSNTLINEAKINSIEKKKQLTKLISSNPEDRLLAIQIASEWKNKNSIPFLRRGLKDSDRRVVIASAAAIASYKGKTTKIQKKPQASRLPPNVSRIR